MNNAIDKVLIIFFTLDRVTISNKDFNKQKNALVTRLEKLFKEKNKTINYYRKVKERIKQKK